ncbi:MAG: alpha-glucan family phosphorylase [Desulfobacterales bacterium]
MRPLKPDDVVRGQFTGHPVYNLLPTEVEGFDALAELALDMHSSWNHYADDVWRQLDPELWESTHNPWVVLQTVSRDRIERVLADPVFRKSVDDLVQTRRQAVTAPAWFQQNHTHSHLSCVAYFSLEFMLSEALPIYSGGLGNVAGDQLKAAGDLGVPVVGVGLLYQQGYFRQVIDKDGAQQALFPYNDPGQLPITPLRRVDGEWLRLKVALPGYSVWLLRLLSDPERPVQIIIAGKAHPDDRAGQALIQEWIQFLRRPEIRPHIVFLSDYDMLLTEHLVQGVDVWINTPRRPWEACGTSGMKVLFNGGINLSELDGWWAEAYTPEVGWGLGDGREHGDDPAWDAVEADTLYDLLEREVIPEFYARDERGIPTAWMGRMRASMAQLTPHFSANHTVREYTEQHYLPAASAYRERAADKGALGWQMVAWRRALEKQWANLQFGDVKVDTTDKQHVFAVRLHLNGIDPKAVRVELYADGLNGSRPVRQEMKRIGRASGALGGTFYRAAVSAARPATDYTARVIPHLDGVSAPLETGKILWQR